MTPRVEAPTVMVEMVDGHTHLLDPSLGATPEEVIEKIAKDQLTGSLVPFSGVWLATFTGSMVRYSDIKRFDRASDVA